jgi:hypothetical protein
MRQFEPKTAVLPPAQKYLWPQLAAAPGLSFVLYGGTAVALHLGHRQSLDFDFFSAAPLDKKRLVTCFEFLAHAPTIQEDPNTLIVAARVKGNPVKVSFFGRLDIGHINEPLRTSDDVLLIASLEDLLATKLKAIIDRAEAKDYIDIAAMLTAGASLARGLGAFSEMFKSDPILPLRALGYFEDGDLHTVPPVQQKLLQAARDRINQIPEIRLRPGLVV